MLEQIDSDRIFPTCFDGFWMWERLNGIMNLSYDHLLHRVKSRRQYTRDAYIYIRDLLNELECAGLSQLTEAVDKRERERERPP